MLETTNQMSSVPTFFGWMLKLGPYSTTNLGSKSLLSIHSRYPLKNLRFPSYLSNIHWWILQFIIQKISIQQYFDELPTPTWYSASFCIRRTRRISWGFFGQCHQWARHHGEEIESSHKIDLSQLFQMFQMFENVWTFVFWNFGIQTLVFIERFGKWNCQRFRGILFRPPNWWP